MARRAPPLLSYSKANLRRVSKAIVSHLSPELLPIKYRAKNADNPMFGHCHTASGCLYKVFGCQSVHMYRALDDNGIWHWWIQDHEGQIIDLTASQYPKAVVKRLYRRGAKAGLLPFNYRQRVKTVLSSVCNDLCLKKPAFCKQKRITNG